MKIYTHILLAGFLLSGLSVAAVPPSATFNDNTNHEAAPMADVAGSRMFEQYAYGFSASRSEMSAMAESILQTGRLSLRLTSEKTVNFRLGEFDIFAPGERKVTTIDDDGTVLNEEPYTGRLFRGLNDDGSNAPAHFSVTPSGLYGIIIDGGIEYSLQPRETLQNGDVRHEVVWTNAPPTVFQGLRGTPVIGEPSPDTITKEFWIKPWAEDSYISYTSAWYDRIVNSYFYASSMWESETNTRIVIYAPADSNRNFASTGACDGFDTGLTKFRDTFVASNMANNRNAYGIFHAYDALQSVAGCGATARLQYWNTSPSLYNKEAVHAIQGKDCCWGDSYDPQNINHLAKAVHHEITHNAGEYGHPGDGSWPCNYNLMINGIIFDCVQFWRTAGTQQSVRTYGWPRFKAV